MNEQNYRFPLDYPELSTAIWFYDVVSSISLVTGVVFFVGNLKLSW